MLFKPRPLITTNILQLHAQSQWMSGHQRGWQIRLWPEGGGFESWPLLLCCIIIWYDLRPLTIKYLSLLSQVYKWLCCGSILSLVQFLFSFVHVYGNVWVKTKENKNWTTTAIKSLRKKLLRKLTDWGYCCYGLASHPGRVKASVHSLNKNHFWQYNNCKKLFFNLTNNANIDN